MINDLLENNNRLVLPGFTTMICLSSLNQKDVGGCTTSQTLLTVGPSIEDPSDDLNILTEDSRELVVELRSFALLGVTHCFHVIHFEYSSANPLHCWMTGCLCFDSW